MTALAESALMAETQAAGDPEGQVLALCPFFNPESSEAFFLHLK